MKKNINNLFIIVLLLFLCNSLIVACKQKQPKNDTVPKTFAELKQCEYEIEQQDEIVMFGDMVIEEDRPLFMGGNANQFAKWVTSQIVYPQSAVDSCIQGRVYIQFVIATDGSIVDIEVLHSVAKELDEEVIRVVSMSPKWTPGKRRIDGKLVRVKYGFPVTFKIQD